MEPMPRSQEQTQLLDRISKLTFGRTRTESITNNICVICGKTVDFTDFKDLPSVKEYRISGMCMPCQDEFFTTGEDT